MTKKRDASRSLGFSENEQATGLSLEQLANQGYGDLGALTKGSGRLIARPVSIFELTPNWTQPRRAIPSSVREQWNGDPNNINELFSAWLVAANAERVGDDLDIGACLEEREDFNRNEDPGPIEDAFLKVIQLAVSIRRDGLTNPVTIVEKEGFFEIETGERRWLAFHLLNAYFGESDVDERGESYDWSMIPARRVETLDVWRQASENSARDNLNAIGKARQFALLLMSLYGADQFEGYDAFTDEQGFYAQVANGSEFPIPRGMGENILNAMGFKNKSQIRRHRDLLRLPPQVWHWADDLNWTEGRIRKFTSKAKSDEELIQLAALEATKEGLGIPISKLPKSVKLTSVKPLYTRGKKLAGSAEKARFRLLQSIGEGVANADDGTKIMLLQEISEIRAWLDNLQSKLDP